VPATVRHLAEQRPRALDAIGRDRSVTGGIPRLEKALEDLVNEPAARARRERRFVFRCFFEPEHIRRKRT
jgi:hypothetical protein